MDCLVLMKAMCSFLMWRTTWPMTQHHVLREMILNCATVKPRNSEFCLHPYAHIFYKIHLCVICPHPCLPCELCLKFSVQNMYEFLISTCATNLTFLNFITHTTLGKSCPITSLNSPTGFQEVKTPRFLDSRHMKVVGCQPYAPAAFTPRDILVHF